MDYNFVISPLFEKQPERLGKKYPSIFSDLKKLRDDLVEEPMQGTA